MDRTTYYSQEQLRSFDLMWFERDALIALSNLTQDILGQTTTVVAGLAATASGTPDMNIHLAAGRIYELAQVDATTWGALALDTQVVFQQGAAAAQAVLLSTSGISAGQSRWSLIQATIGVVDAIRAGDPTGGVRYYYNSSNPAQPFQGPGNTGTTNNTVREMVMSISVVQGTPATTGSEVPPSAGAGQVGLYLVDLTFGQTAITNVEILVAGPSVGTGVPSNYPIAPFLAGLLNSHHGGTPGQAPKINLATETTGTLPPGSIPNSTATGILQFSSTTLIKFLPRGGNSIVINGAILSIASAGISIANTGVEISGTPASNLAANTCYDVYLKNVSGTPTASFWPDAGGGTHMTDTTAGNIGIEVRNSGGGTPDPTRSYIGKVLTDGSSHFQQSATVIGVISWFSRRDVAAQNNGSPTSPATSPTDLGSTVQTKFITFAEEAIEISIYGQGDNSVAGGSVTIVPGIDGAAISTGQQSTYYSAGVGNNGTLTNGWKGTVAEGSHVATVMAQVNANTGTFILATNVRVRG